MRIRAAAPGDLDAMWAIFETVARSGDTVPWSDETGRDDVRAQWLEGGPGSFVAVADDDRVLGMYQLGPNHVGRGSHVGSATFLVDAGHRRCGVGRSMLADCIARGRDAGFVALQFNYVVRSNVAALALYEAFGFEIVGTLPGAFRHARLGDVDAVVLFKRL